MDARSASPASSQRETLPQLEPTRREASGAPLVSLSDLADLDLSIEVHLGHVSITIRELLELGVGSVLQLDRLTGEHLETFVNGTPIARGEIRVHGERFALRITEVLRARRLDESEGDGKDETPEVDDS
jgi:flagellar motor switch protein FliN